MTESLRFRMFPRKQLDIGWADLAHAALYCSFPRSICAKEAELEGMFASPFPVLSAFTVRTGFDLCLGALGLQAGSEILMSALTIKEMVNIARHHGLVPIPLDIESGTMAPEIAKIEAAITERTRAIVMAHLFGTRMPLGGALLRVKDAELLRKMRVIQRTHPAQTRKDFARVILTHVILKVFTLPLLFGLFYRVSALLGADFEEVIAKVRGLDEEDWLKEIQWQCSYPLLALLAHRLRTFDAARLNKRIRVGEKFAKSLPREISYLGNRAAV